MFKLLVAVCAVGTVLLLALPFVGILFAVLALSFLVGWAFLLRIESRPEVRRVYLLGLVLRVVATAVAYKLIVPAYNGGDTLSYYRRGQAGASALLSGQWPTVRIFPGTGSVDFLSSVVQIVVPGPASAVGLLFAFFAWCGCVLFCQALVRAPGVSEVSATWFRILVMVLPSILLWPSVQGKDGLVVFGAGLATYGALHLHRRRLGSIAVGLALVVVVRPHIAVLLVVAMALSPVGSRTAAGRRGGVARLAVLLGLVAVIVPVALQYINSHVGGGTIQELTGDISERTSYGGSSFTPPNLASPVGALLALPTAYFRPTLLEATTPALLLSSLESTLLALAVLGLVFRRGWISGVLISPHHRYCLILTIAGGFLLALLGNYGLLVRQRVLFEMCLLFLTIAPPLLNRETSDVPAETDRSGKVST